MASPGKRMDLEANLPGLRENKLRNISAANVATLRDVPSLPIEIFPRNDFKVKIYKIIKTNVT